MERKQYWWQGSITIPTPIISWLGSIWSIPNPSTIPIQTKCFSIWVHHSQLYRSPTTQRKREPWNEEDTDPGTISALSLSLHFVLHYIAISIVTENMFCSSTCGPLRIKALDSITYPMSPTISPLRRRNQYSFKNYVERCQSSEWVHPSFRTSIVPHVGEVTRYHHRLRTEKMRYSLTSGISNSMKLMQACGSETVVGSTTQQNS